MKPRDYALAPSPDGTRLVLHRPDCPAVRKQAEDGDIVLTMFQCANEPDDIADLERHDCLQAQ